MLRQIVNESSVPLRNSYKLSIDIYADEYDVAKRYTEELNALIVRFHKMKERDIERPVELRFSESTLF